eukprot:augustus_masked-scaffold_6-processed-gene-14.62-mRNA-1 protein AED:0.16 eAED:0.30 QI:0/0/0/1/1/1/3/201/695
MYIGMGLPELFGFIFAQALRRLGPLNLYPFEVGALQLSPFIHRGRIYCRLVVYDATFGNPPDFPFENFLEVGKLDMDASVKLSDFKNLFTLTPKPSPLRKVPDFKYFLKFDFDHIEISDAQCNFQMYDGKFNINEFTKILATGEAKQVLGKDPFPNQLQVTILRGRNLKPHRLKRTIDPYVVVRIRRNHKHTSTKTETLDPMYNETLCFNLDDPSVVMEIAVYDRDSPSGTQMTFIGHWAMTTKYLICDPTFTFHVKNKYKVYPHKSLGRKARFADPKKADYDYESEDDFENEDIEKTASYKQLGFRGWVPLAQKNWEQMGECGLLEVKVVWKHVDQDQLEVDQFKEKRNYTALEQLSQHSAEDQLRFGAWSRLKNWLEHEPFCYDVKRFTIRRTHFFLQDLFRGYEGKNKPRLRSESILRAASRRKVIGQQQQQDVTGSVPIEFMEMTERFRPKNGDIGVTTFHVFFNFFLGLIFEFARKGKTGRAVAQIMSSGIFNLRTSVVNAVKGDFQNTTLGPSGLKQYMNNVINASIASVQVMHQKTTANRQNASKFKYPIDAYDEDFLLPADRVEISGYLERMPMRVVGQITTEKMKQLLKKNFGVGNFKKKFFELKGNTLFYRRDENIVQGKVYNLTYKLALADIHSIIYSRSKEELVLNVQMHEHIIRLRQPKNKDGVQRRSLQKWLSVFATHNIA